MTRFKTVALLGFAVTLMMLQTISPGAKSATALDSVIGKYGFDWLQPARAKCALVTEATAARFKSCTAAGPNSNGSFTGKKDYYSCPAGKGSEYMIYPTKARCSEELETMKANGD